MPDGRLPIDNVVGLATVNALCALRENTQNSLNNNGVLATPPSFIVVVVEALSQILSSLSSLKLHLCLFLSIGCVHVVPKMHMGYREGPGRFRVMIATDARLEPPVIRLTNDSNQFSLGRAFYPSQIPIKSTSFFTHFISSILPDDSSSPGFGLAFVLSASTSPPNALSGQYLGLFSNATVHTVAPLLAVEFDTGRNPEFNDPDTNHVGIDLNSIESIVTQTAGYYNDSDSFVPRQNIDAWIEFNGPEFEINVTIAPAGMPRPVRTLLSYKNPIIANYTSDQMYMEFSASKIQWVEAQRLLVWSFSDSGVARDINTTNLPFFSWKIRGLHYLRRRSEKEEDDVIEDWELEHWPHRISYEELSQATKGFCKDELLGAGGFGKVYKGILANKTEVAVKCVNHDSRQGIREFMAEILTIGRLQHKNLVQMKGWCRKGNELMIVYDYMPNGSLNKWIFDRPEKVMNWVDRRKVLADVAEGLNYLHHGWEQVVVHRDIKSSNVLLDGEMRGRLGAFGLAKLYTHGGVPNTTRVVGTLGYLAPEVVTRANPTAASDVYSFGVGEGRLCEAADDRIKGQYSEDEMEAMLKLGLTCCHPDPLRRPTMSEVVAVLLGENVDATPNELLAELTPRESNIRDRSDWVSEESDPLSAV
ncbi:hypothetical protein RND71_029883 [Anisodus tanguticus]|uniref:non-specific serine/threonine protein kinase n=1 Tax=Anisodus tanguticus TaxID=243964 RepID=A0AAE1RE92_9SOLA|nr:hypothetical protein RND71_029883 [Anisodus tanguticus]